MSRKQFALFDPALASAALGDAFKKLDPRAQARDAFASLARTLEQAGSGLAHPLLGARDAVARVAPARRQ